MKRRKFIKNTAVASTAMVLPPFIDTERAPYFGNGVHNGWADQDSVAIWTRLTKNPELNAQGVPFIELTKEQQKHFEALLDSLPAGEPPAKQGFFDRVKEFFV